MNKVSLCLLVVGSLAVSACGVEASNDSENASDESVGVVSEALTAPPAGVGFTWQGNYHLKNASGNYCAYKNGSKFETTACSSASNQLFAIYLMSNGRREICVPNTLYESGEYLSWWNATCLVRDGSTNLKFATKSLAMNGGSGWQAYAGDVVVESQLANGWVLGWYNTTKKFQRFASGGIGLDNYTGATNQQWTWY